MIREVCRRLHHASRVARGADATAFAGIGHEGVVPAVITSRPGKAVRKDAALQILTKRQTHIGHWRVVVTLTAELAGTGERMPGKKVLGNRLVQQRAAAGGAGCRARALHALAHQRADMLALGGRWWAWGSASRRWVPDDTVVMYSASRF